jgi:hypothetical protein
VVIQMGTFHNATGMPSASVCSICAALWSFSAAASLQAFWLRCLLTR